MARMLFLSLRRSAFHLARDPTERSVLEMRRLTCGDDQQQNHIFSYLSPEARVRKDHPLRAIRVMVDEVLVCSHGNHPDITGHLAACGEASRGPSHTAI
jgi:hypothetical protein